MQARYYDTNAGRFLSVDPVTFLDNGNPGYFNRYSYTLNEPINMIDPTGMYVCGTRVGVIDCQKIDTAVSKIEEARDYYSEGSKEHDLLSEVLDDLGPKGEEGSETISVESVGAPGMHSGKEGVVLNPSTMKHDPISIAEVITHEMGHHDVYEARGGEHPEDAGAKNGLDYILDEAVAAKTSDALRRAHGKPTSPNVAVKRGILALKSQCARASFNICN